MRVYVIETGDYEQRMVWGVASSPEAAEASIRADYGPPYIVRWEPLEHGSRKTWSLTGHFEAVPGYSTQHTASWSIYAYELIESAP